MNALRLAICAYLFLVAAQALADSPAMPRPYRVPVGVDEEFVFVMLPRPGADADFPVSGLYRNDGGATPLWTVPWYAFGVHVSVDGRHLVRMGPWATGGESLAVAFYDLGEEVARYAVEDLVADLDRLPRSVSHILWRREVDFDAATNRLRIATLNDEHYQFDVASGAIVERGKPMQPVFGALVHLLDGTSIELQDLTACTGLFLELAKMKEGVIAAQRFYGYVDVGDGASADAADRSQTLKLYSVPFAVLARIERADASGDGRPLRWLLHTVDGKALELWTDVGDVAFCGHTAAAQEHRASGEQILSITFR